MKTHNLFISHSWTYSDSYDKLIGLMDARPYFTYRNYSVPKDDPIHNARFSSYTPSRDPEKDEPLRSCPYPSWRLRHLQQMDQH